MAFIGGRMHTGNFIMGTTNRDFCIGTGTAIVEGSKYGRYMYVMHTHSLIPDSMICVVLYGILM